MPNVYKSLAFIDAVGVAPPDGPVSHCEYQITDHYTRIATSVGTGPGIK